MNTFQNKLGLVKNMDSNDYLVILNNLLRILDEVPNPAVAVPAPVAKPNAPPAPVAAPPVVAPPSASSTSVGVAGAPPLPSGPVQPPQTSTSWAAAAGKGLPTTTNDQTHTTSTASASNGSTSKHLEQLNSVREALFSQDGWGGANVKQDSAWNVDGMASNATSGSGSGSQPANPAAAPSGGNTEAKESNTWGSAGSGHRNDGTDLWRVNLSGQPPAPKPQPNNAWNHTPQNNTDFKQWGVDDEDGPNQGNGGNANGAIGGQRQNNVNVPPNMAGNGGPNSGNAGPGAPGGGDSMWGNSDNVNNGPTNQFKRNNDWSSSGSTGSWGDAPRGGEPMMNRNMNDPMGHRGDAGNNGAGGGPGGPGNTSGWGPSPQKQPISQWGGNSGPGPRNTGSWDLESPNMQRRGVDDGTSHWGFKPQQPSAPGTAGKLINLYDKKS